MGDLFYRAFEDVACADFHAINLRFLVDDAGRLGDIPAAVLSSQLKCKLKLAKYLAILLQFLEFVFNNWALVIV